MLPSNYVGLLGCDLRPMSEEETETFMRCFMMERELDGKSVEEVNKREGELDNSAGFGWNVFTKRLNFHNIKATIPLRLFILTLCENPAQVVLWTFTFAKIYEKIGFKTVGISEFADNFPNGIPVDSEYRRIWDLQKRKGEKPAYGTDNWLDYAEVWPKISA